MTCQAKTFMLQVTNIVTFGRKSTLLVKAVTPLGDRGYQR
jgi:hypothetical protein